MRPKITYYFLVIASLAIISCRETEELAFYEPTDNLNKSQLKIPKTIYDTIGKDLINNLEDPPKTGTNWRIAK